MKQWKIRGHKENWACPVFVCTGCEHTFTWHWGNVFEDITKSTPMKIECEACDVLLSPRDKRELLFVWRMGLV